MTLEWLLAYLALGAFTGFMSGLLGVGGGGIIVPLLASMFASQGFAADSVLQLSLGTAMTSMIFSSIASMNAHAAYGSVKWCVVKRMVIGISIGVLLATQIATHLDPIVIALFFATFMALVAVQLFVNWQPAVSLSRLNNRELIGAGFGIGSVSALAAVGGGFLTILYLNYKNLGMKKAIGTSAAIGCAIAISGSLGFIYSGWENTQSHAYTLGYVYLPAFVAITAGSTLFARVGARFAQNLPDKLLKKIFALLSLAMSVKMVCGVMM